MSYICKHFGIEELVPERVFKKIGSRAWQLLDDRLLITIDALREEFGSITINNWKWNGSRQYSGLRDEHFYSSVTSYLSSRSQHKYGRAADMLFNVSADKVRKFILENPEKFPYVTFVECSPLDKKGKAMSWVHVDVRNADLVCWSPVEGVISKEEVIRRGL